MRKLLSEIIETTIPIILVISNKGGVGKTSIAVSLAVELSKTMRVGLIDVDITNPSVPHLLDLDGKRPEVKSMIEAIRHPKYNIQIISIGFFLPERDQYIALNGETKKSTIRQFTRSVSFDDIDIIVVDSPPTTSDEILETLALFPRKQTGAVIVTEPSTLSLNGACKSLRLLKEKGFLVKGFITNKDGIKCRRCGEINPLYYIEESVESVAKRYKIPHLGRLPHLPPKDRKLIIDTKEFQEIVQRILTEQGVQFKPLTRKLGLMTKLFKGIKVAFQLWRS